MHLIIEFCHPNSLVLRHGSVAIALLRKWLKISFLLSTAVKFVCLVYSKAFHAMYDNILIAILHYSGFSDAASCFKRSVLSGRTQQVRLKQGLSSCRRVVCKVPQGCMLGPLMYAIIHLVLSATCSTASSMRMISSFIVRFLKMRPNYTVAE